MTSGPTFRDLAVWTAQAFVIVAVAFSAVYGLIVVISKAAR